MFKNLTYQIDIYSVFLTQLTFIYTIKWHFYCELFQSVETFFNGLNTACRCCVYSIKSILLMFHWENSLHFDYAPSCVSFMHLTALMHLQNSFPNASSCLLLFLHTRSLRIIIKGSIITQTLQTQSKGKVFYVQEPPSGESTTTECGFNYQLLAVIYRSSPMGSP